MAFIFEILRRAAADLLLPRVPSVMFLPLLNFFAPVYMGLAFTHYGLDKLAQSRRELLT